MPTTESPYIDPEAPRRAAVAALHRLADLVAADDRIPVPTAVALWSHQHEGSVSDVDVFAGALPDVIRRGDHTAAIPDIAMIAIGRGFPLAPLTVSLAMAVYPDSRPVEPWDSGSTKH